MGLSVLSPTCRLGSVRSFHPSFLIFFPRGSQFGYRVFCAIGKIEPSFLSVFTVAGRYIRNDN
jgi:hypothetical protein